jgi:hypothetical protein
MLNYYLYEKGEWAIEANTWILGSSQRRPDAGSGIRCRARMNRHRPWNWQAWSYRDAQIPAVAPYEHPESRIFEKGAATT